MDIYQIIKRPLHTEKSVSSRDSANKYYFEVDRKANKIQIRNAIEKLFSVKVVKVRTLIKKGKIRRTRNVIGKTPDLKKAVVTLRAGDTIDLGY